MKNKNIKITIVAIVVAFIITTIIYIIGRNIYISRDAKYNLFKNIEERYDKNYELLQLREIQAGDNEISWGAGYSALFISDNKYISASYDKYKKEYKEETLNYEPADTYINSALENEDCLVQTKTGEDVTGDGTIYRVYIIIKEEYFTNTSKFKSDMLQILQNYVDDESIALYVYIARDEEIDTKYYKAVPYVYHTTDEHVEYDSISNNTNILDEVVFLGQKGDSYSELSDEVNAMYDNSIRDM